MAEHQQPQADKVAALLTSISGAIMEALVTHHLQHTLADQDDHLPLVDRLTPDGDKDITRGNEELELLRDAIYLEIEPFVRRFALLAAPSPSNGEGADLRAPAILPESMSRDEMLKYYSEYANLVAHEVFGYQRQIHELRAALAAATPPEPKKLWLWKNFVDGRPEYWAFDNPYPTRLDCGDPQTLGEPCGYALFKPSRDGSHGRTEEQVLRAVMRVWYPSEHQQLMKFYGADTITELVDKQARHIEKLQAKLPPSPSLAPQQVRKA